MSRFNRDERYKLYRIDEQLILTMLSAWNRYDSIHLPKAINLPEGYEIHGVEYHFAHRGFAFLVWHPSFEPVPLGTMTPLADLFAEFEFVELRRSDLPLPRGGTAQEITGQIEYLQGLLVDAAAREALAAGGAA